MHRFTIAGVLLYGLLAGCAPGATDEANAGTAAATATGARVDTIDLARLAAEGRLHPVHRTVEPFEDGGRRGVRVDERDVKGVVWIDDVTFDSGTVELEVRGRNVRGSSFVGVAFHAADDSTYDAVYLRPFNFLAADSAARSHGVQYVSHPAHTWRLLRERHPGVYEQPVEPAPDPEAWIPLRLVTGGGRVSVHVNGAERPSLVVEQLSDRRSGRLGLWVGNPSDGAYANLRVTPAS